MDKTNHEGRTCSNCKWCGVQPGGGKELVFQCRYRTPKLIAQILMTQQGPAWDIRGAWPPVDKDAWCRKFEPQLH